MAVKIGDLFVDLRANAGRFAAEMGKATGGLDNFTKNAKKTQASAFQMTGALIGVGSAFAIITKTVGLASASVQRFAALESQLVRVGAVSQATADEMVKITEAAKTLGSSTVFSAAEAAEGMTFLAMAGQNANQIVGAMPAVLQLAQAAAVDLGTSADIVTNIMAGFGKEVGELARVNDTLVATFTGSNVTLQELGEAFKVVGPVAKTLGLEFDELSATIGVLGNAGIKASLAGTGLKRSLTSIINASPKARKAMDVLGIVSDDAAKGFTNLAAKLEKARGELSQKEFTGKLFEAFGERAGPILAALVEQGSDAISKLSDKIAGANGLAAAIQKAELATTTGQFKLMTSAIDGLATSIGKKLGPSAVKAFKSLRKMANVLNAIIEGPQEVAGSRQLADLTKAREELLGATSKLESALARGFKSPTEGMERVNEILVGVADNAKVTTKNVRAFFNLGEDSRVAEVTANLNEQLRRVLARIAKLKGETPKTTDAITELGEKGEKAFVATFAAVSRLVEKQREAGEAIGMAQTAEQADKASRAFFRSSQALKDMRDAGGEIVSVFEKAAAAAADMAEATTKAATEMANQLAGTILAPGAVDQGGLISGGAQQVDFAPLTGTAIPSGVAGMAAEPVQEADAFRKAMEDLRATTMELNDETRLLASGFPDLAATISGSKVKLQDLEAAADNAGEANEDIVEAAKALKKSIEGELATRLSAIKGAQKQREAMAFVADEAKKLGINFADVADQVKRVGPGPTAGADAAANLLGGNFGQKIGEALGAAAPMIGAAAGGPIGSALGSAAGAVLQETFGRISEALAASFGRITNVVLGDPTLQGAVSAFGEVFAPIAPVVAALLPGFLALAAVVLASLPGLILIGLIFQPLIPIFAALAAVVSIVLAILAVFFALLAIVVAVLSILVAVIGALITIALTPLIVVMTLLAALLTVVLLALSVVVAVLALIALVIVVTTLAFVALIIVITLLVSGLGPLIFVLGQFLAALVLGPAVIFGLFAAFAFLLTQTETFGQITKAIGAVVKDKLLAPMERFAKQLVFLVGLTERVLEVFQAIGGGSGEASARALFEVLRFISVGLLDFLSVIFGISNALISFAQLMLLGASKFVEIVSEIASFFGRDTEKLDKFGESLTGTSAALEDLRIDTEKFDAAIDKLRATTFEAETEAGQEIIDALKDVNDSAEDVRDSFTGLTESTGNLPQFFRVARLRADAAMPGQGGIPPTRATAGELTLPGAGGGGGGGGVTIIVESLTVQANDIFSLGEELQEAAERRFVADTGSPDGNASGSGNNGG